MLQELRFAEELSFQQLKHLTKLHRNTVADNLKILVKSGLVAKPKRGRYRILDEARAWSYVEKHTFDMERLLKHPVAKRISRITYRSAALASKQSLRPYIFELSKYPDGKPYGLQGIKAARMLRSHLRDRNWRVLRASGMQGPDTAAETAAKTPLRSSHLLFDSAWLRLAQGKGNELDWPILFLTFLTQYKWQSIQFLELYYLRPETPEEEKWLSEPDGDHWKKIKEEKRQIQADYAEWKRHEEEYVHGFREIAKEVLRNVMVTPPLTILDRKGNIVRTISYSQFKAEESRDFSNWKREMSSAEANRLIDICRKRFKDPPRHFLDWLRDRVAHARSIYAEGMWFISQKYKEELRKLADLGVLERINPDIVRAEDFRKCLREDQLVIDSAAHLKALQEIVSPFRLTLAENSGSNQND